MVVEVVVVLAVAAGVLLVFQEGRCLAGSFQSKRVFSLSEYGMEVHIAIVAVTVVSKVPRLGKPINVQIMRETDKVVKKSIELADFLTCLVASFPKDVLRL